MLRNSPLFQFRHGDHVCVFYRSEDSLREVLTPYVADGLRRNERCFCVQKSHIAKRLIFDLQFLGIDTDDASRRGALEIHTEEEVYLTGGRFEPHAMMNLLMRSLDDALANGFTAFRTAGELSWAARGKNTCNQMLDYEHMVEECFPGRHAIGLCQYDMNAFEPEVLDGVIRAHRLHLDDESPSLIHSGITIRHGNYWSEIVADKLVLSPSYYYVVQRQRPSEIIGWGTAPTFDTASERAEQLALEADRN